jgi:hypothetical protein
LYVYSTTPAHFPNRSNISNQELVYPCEHTLYNPTHLRLLVNIRIKLRRELLPPLSIRTHPHGNTRPRTLEQPVPLVINLDLALLPAQQIRPLLARMHLADGHPDLARARITHDTRQPGLAIPRAAAHKANAVCVVEVVLLVAVGVELAGKNQIRQLAAARGPGLVLALEPVQVAVEGTRVALRAQQDQRVRERLEEALDGRFDGLPRLRVVVRHDGDGADGGRLDEGVVEDLAQVGGFGFGEGREVVQQRRVVQRELVVHVIEPGAHELHVARPELAHDEDVVAALAPHRLEPLAREPRAEVLHRVQPEPLEPQLLGDPDTPLLDVLAHLRVRVVDVGEHHVVSVSRLAVDRLAPALVVANDLIDGLLLIRLVVVCAAKVLPVVLLRRVLVAAAGEVEAEPALDFVHVGNLFVAVVVVDLDDAALLGAVRARLVVQHRVPVQPDAVVLCDLGELHQVLLGAPFGGLLALLVKLAQVVQVVDVIAVALWAGGFAAGGEPDVLDADGGELGDLGYQALPVLVVGGDVPLEALEEGVVLRRGLLLWFAGLAWCFAVE